MLATDPCDCKVFQNEKESKIERVLLIQKQNRILNDMYRNGKYTFKNEIIFR